MIFISMISTIKKKKKTLAIFIKIVQSIFTLAAGLFWRVS